MNKQLVMRGLKIGFVLSVLASLPVGVYYAANAETGSEAKGTVTIAGPISTAQRLEVLKRIAGFDLPAGEIKQLQARLREIPWIARVAVEKKWPSDAVITITPEQPIALWNDDAYLNGEGKVFQSPFTNQTRLPQLYGPEGQEEAVMQQYQLLGSTLFSIDQRIEFLELGQRGEWRFRTDRGIDVLLGNTDLMERVQRLVQVAAHIEALGKLDQVNHIDTRYSNGAAVYWKEDKDDLNVATNYNSQREIKL